MKLENVVGLVGGTAALVGCFLPLVHTRIDAFLVGQSEGLAFMLYVLATLGIIASLAGLLGWARKEEYVQTVVGLLGLIIGFIVYHQADIELGDGGTAGWGAQLLFWGFGMVLAEGLINFRDHKLSFSGSE